MTAKNDAARQFRRFRMMSRAVGWMPRPLARLYARIHTGLQLSFGSFERVRANVIDNIAPALPPGADPGPVADRLLLRYGMFLMDYFRIPAMKPKWIPKMFRPMTGVEHVETALKAGKGAILVTPHLGNWEMGGIALKLRGTPVTVVAVPDPVNPGITLFRDWARGLHGIQVVNIEPGLLTPIALARVLEENGVVALLGDRNFFESDPVDVEFLGRRAKFPRGPALLSLATGAPLLPVFVTFGEKGRYDAMVCPPVKVAAEGSKSEQAAVMTQAVARIFEAKIRAFPDQWFVFDPYWGQKEPLTNIARAAAGLAGEGTVSPLK